MKIHIELIGLIYPQNIKRMSRGSKHGYLISFMHAYHKVQYFFIAKDLPRRKKDYQSVLLSWMTFETQAA